jgi:predicted ATPase
MITRVQIKNFRNLADVDVELGPLTVLVGRNGAGKSTFLDALRFVRDALRLGLDTAISQRGGISALRRWSPRGRTYDMEISLELQETDGWARYSFLLGTGQKETRRVKHEILQIMSKSHTANYTTQFETKSGKWMTPPSDFLINQDQTRAIPIAPDFLMLPSVSNFFSSIDVIRRNIIAASYYSVFPNTLRIPQKQTSETMLFEDGQNLATTLRNIKKHGEFYSDLVAALGRVVEDVYDLRVVEAGGYLVTELKHEAQNSHSPWFPLAQESDGTLRVLALLAALYQNSPHSLLAIEEPELSIHPGALAMLSDVIKEAATRSQIIITTQSPDLISRFSADQLRVVERVGGDTLIGPIDEGQRESINAQLFSAGDLLRIEGLHVEAQEETIASHA